MLSVILCAAVLSATPEDIYKAALDKVDRAAAIKSLEAAVRNAKANVGATSRRMKNSNISPVARKAQIDAATAKVKDAQQELKRVKDGGEVRMELNPHELSVGDAGYFAYAVEVRQVIDRGTMLVAPISDDSITEPFLLKGVSSAGMADRSNVRVACPVAVTGTTAYTTVLGAKKTVLVVEAVSRQIATDTAKPKKATKP